MKVVSSLVGLACGVVLVAKSAFAQSWYDYSSGLNWSLYYSELTWDNAISPRVCESFGPTYRLPSVSDFRNGSTVLRDAMYNVGALGSYLWTSQVDSSDYSLARAYRLYERNDYPITRNTALAVVCVSGGQVNPPPPPSRLPVYQYDSNSNRYFAFVARDRDWYNAGSTCDLFSDNTGRRYRLPTFSELDQARNNLRYGPVGKEARNNRYFWTTYRTYSPDQAYAVNIDGSGLYFNLSLRNNVVCISQY